MLNQVSLILSNCLLKDACKVSPKELSEFYNLTHLLCCPKEKRKARIALGKRTIYTVL